MDYFTLVQRAVDLIEEFPSERVQICDLAGAVYCSEAHFSRVFRGIVGMSVMEYVRCRRLSLAGREIVFTRARVIDVALKYGYETPEAFSKAFKRFHGLSPVACRKSGAPKYLERSFPLAIKIKLSEGDINMSNFGSPLNKILEELDRNSADLYFCFKTGSKQFAIPALQVCGILSVRDLFVNTEGKLCFIQWGNTLPVINMNESASFDEIAVGRQSILLCSMRQAPNQKITAENGFFGLVVDGNPELKLVTDVNKEATPIVQADALKKQFANQFATVFEKSENQPMWQQSIEEENDAQKRLEFQAYNAEILARNASIEAVGGMEHHKGTMVIAYELHRHAVELAKIAREFRERGR